MTSKVYIDYVTPVDAASLNDINNHVYSSTPISPATTVHPSSVIATTPTGTNIEVTVQATLSGIDTRKATLAGSATQTFAAANAVAATDVINKGQIAASAGASLVGFIQSGAGTVVRTVQDKGRESISVKDFGAVGDGVTDDTVAIQAALNASHRVYFPLGSYLISSTLLITRAAALFGEIASFTDITSVSELLYTGTGVALSITPVAGKTYNSTINNLLIRASGSAATSATAVGLLLTSSNYGVFTNLVVKGFAAGTGIKVTATVGAIGASNSFYSCILWNNNTGYSFGGVAVGSADYASILFGGAVIGSGAVGSVGMLVDQYAAETMAYGTDFETFDVCIDLYGNGTTSGGGVKLIGVRTEFQTTAAVRVNTTTLGTLLLGHRFSGGASATWLIDNGTRTFRTDIDSNIRINTGSLQMLNNIPLTMQDTGGVDHQLIKFATNNTVQWGTSSGNGNYALGNWLYQAQMAMSHTAPAYGLTVPINAALGNIFAVTVTDGVAFTMGNPSNAATGQKITITVRNTSGGAAGALSFSTLYKVAAWIQPATGFSRSITFEYNGTNWIEISRTPSDVPN